MMDRRRLTTFLLALPSLTLASRVEAAKAPTEDGTAALIVSRIRAGRGLGPVSIDPRMTASARHQARAVARIGRLDHGDFAGRVRRFGIQGSAAENLAYGSIDLAGAMAQWQASPPHLRNLLMAGATRMGIGRADRGKTRFWAMVIG